MPLILFLKTRCSFAEHCRFGFALEPWPLKVVACSVQVLACAASDTYRGMNSEEVMRSIRQKFQDQDAFTKHLCDD